MKRKRAIIYARMNHPTEEVLRKEHGACLEFCQRFDMEIVGTLLDIAPGNTLNRPKLDELRLMIHAHHINVVVIYATHRLSRDSIHLAILTKEAKTAGVEVFSVIGGMGDSLSSFSMIGTSQEGEMLACLLRNIEYREQERWQKHS